MINITGITYDAVTEGNKFPCELKDCVDKMETATTVILSPGADEDGK